MTESEDLCKSRAISHLQSAIQLLELMGYLPVGRVINDIQIIKQDILELGKRGLNDRIISQRR